MKQLRLIIFFLLLASNHAMADTDPVKWEIISEALPQHSSLYSIYHITYEMTSQLPFTMPTPLYIDTQTNTDEFIISDSCSQAYLKPGERCQVLVTLNPDIHGHKSAALTIQYGDTKIPLPPLKTFTAEATSSWTGLIGVDYNPNHYSENLVLNIHDIFYVGTTPNGKPMSNVYAELMQLQAAGFNTARSYQTIAYAWIDIINQANALNMNVIYEAVIPQDGDGSDITAAKDVLNDVIAQVGTSIFQDTVSLVFAGHENYNGLNVDYLTDAVTSLQNALSAQNLTTPVGSALLSGDLVTPGSPSDMQTLINSYSPSAPLAFDPYPFQWGVPIADAVFTSPPPQTINSIAWDYEQIMMQTFYQSPRPILMAETGWATEGTNSGYYCYLNPTTNPCEPGVGNAATYLTDLYAYVRNAKNLSGALVFYAYDEPAKVPTDPSNAENHYGMFDQDCNLKNNNTSLLPNTAYNSANYDGCQGFALGTYFVPLGLSPDNQPPFTVAITQQNPQTNQSADISVVVATANRNNINVTPWPYFLLFNNAQITITGSNPSNVCTGTAAVSSDVVPVLTLPAALNCTNLQVNCSGMNCFLPDDY